MSANFIVSARKYRPDTWETVVGQKSITSTLQNAIANNQIAQAYLFTGPRGVGKTTCARIFARAVNESEPGADLDLSFNVFELDAASNNSVEDIRNIVDTVRIPPQVGRFKVYIIDEVHMLSTQAFNAFLKTLEEPPAHAIFILATTEKHKIIPTILSRCQTFDFNRIRVKDMSEHLAFIATKEGITADPEALHVIAEKADGAMRDALSIFDQVVAFCGRHLTYSEVIQNLNVLDYEYYFKLTDFILKEDISASLSLFDEVLNKGFDAHHFVVGIGSHFRNLLVCKDPVTIPLLEVSDQVASRYQQQAEAADLRLLIEGIDLVNQCDMQYRGSKHQRLLVELLLMKLGSIRYNQGGGEKKKFRLKPFRRDDVKPSVGRVSTVASSKQAPEPPQASAPKVIAAPAKSAVLSGTVIQSNGLISDVLSIKSLRNTRSQAAAEAAQTEVLEEPTREYSQEEIVRAWNEFIHRRLTTNKQVQTAFKVAVIELTEGRFLRVAFPSQTQHHYFSGARGELAEFLRSEFQITGIQFTLDVQKSDEIKLSTRTDKEKLDAVGEKYPALKTLARKFQLRVD